MAEDSVYKQLEAVFDEVQNTCTVESKRVLRKHANKLTRQIKKDSPKRKGGTQKYAKGWTTETEHESAFDLSLVVRNKAEPTLPHLLENSHRIIVRQGKKGGYVMVDTGKETKPHPHILANAEKEIELTFEDLTKGGGT